MSTPDDAVASEPPISAGKRHIEEVSSDDDDIQLLSARGPLLVVSDGDEEDEETDDGGTTKRQRTEIDLTIPEEPAPTPIVRTVVVEVEAKRQLTCPVCLGDAVEPTSTKCGHIFCWECIRAAAKITRRCPNCRKPLAVKDVHRIYL